MSYLTSTHDYPSFQDAVARLGQYLEEHAWPTDVQWVDGENVTRSGDALVVHAKHLREAGAVRTEYWHAVPRRLGIRLHALAHDANHSYCYLWAPSNRLDADVGLLFDGLKLSLAGGDARAKLVGSLRYRWYRWRSRKQVAPDLFDFPDSQIIHRPDSAALGGAP